MRYVFFPSMFKHVFLCVPDCVLFPDENKLRRNTQLLKPKDVLVKQARNIKYDNVAMPGLFSIGDGQVFLPFCAMKDVAI